MNCNVKPVICYVLNHWQLQTNWRRLAASRFFVAVSYWQFGNCHQFSADRSWICVIFGHNFWSCKLHGKSMLKKVDTLDLILMHAILSSFVVTRTCVGRWCVDWERDRSQCGYLVNLTMMLISDSRSWRYWSLKSRLVDGCVTYSILLASVIFLMFMADVWANLSSCILTMLLLHSEWLEWLYMVSIACIIHCVI